jgi:hypothetical protein
MTARIAMLGTRMCQHSVRRCFFRTANTADTVVPMEKFTSGRGVLNLQPSTYLRLWEWREDKINL